MRKILLLLILAFAVTANGNAQSFFSKLFSRNSNKTETTETKEEKKTDESDLLGIGKSLLGGVVDNIVAAKKITAADLAGTWNYEGVSCKLESEDMLAEVGAKLVTAKVEEKFNEYLLKVGVKKGNAAVQFAEDGTFVADFSGKQIQGTYAVGEDGNSVVFSFLMGKISLNSVVEYTSTGMNISFEADRVLSVIKSVSSAASQYANAQQSQSSALTMISTLSSLLEGYNGMRLGMRLTR